MPAKGNRCRTNPPIAVERSQQVSGTVIDTGKATCHPAFSVRGIFSPSCARKVWAMASIRRRELFSSRTAIRAAPGILQISWSNCLARSRSFVDKQRPDLRELSHDFRFLVAQDIGILQDGRDHAVIARKDSLVELIRNQLARNDRLLRLPEKDSFRPVEIVSSPPRINLHRLRPAPVAFGHGSRRGRHPQRLYGSSKNGARAT